MADSSVKSIGLDTWGVDFGLLDAQDTLIEDPYHYRDDRTDGMMKAVFDVLPRDEVYGKTGIQFTRISIGSLAITECGFSHQQGYIIHHDLLTRFIEKDCHVVSRSQTSSR